MCKGRYLHRYEIIQQHNDGVLENCSICHRNRFFKAVGGQVENGAYMAYHLRLAIANLPLWGYIWHEFEYDPLSDNVVSPYV